MGIDEVLSNLNIIRFPVYFSYSKQARTIFKGLCVIQKRRDCERVLALP